MTDRMRETIGETVGEKDPTVSAEERRRMVAEAAYFRAACRDFVPGGEFRDWIEAEAEIKRLLSGATSGKDRHNITRR